MDCSLTSWSFFVFPLFWIKSHVVIKNGRVIKCKNSSNTVNHFLHFHGSWEEQPPGMDALWWVKLIQYRKATLQIQGRKSTFLMGKRQSCCGKWKSPKPHTAHTGKQEEICKSYRWKQTYKDPSHQMPFSDLRYLWAGFFLPIAVSTNSAFLQ